MSRERKTGRDAQYQPGTPFPESLGTLMLSSSFSRCSSCFSSSATRIMFSFSRSRSFSVSCRMGRAGSGLALKSGHTAQLNSNQDLGPKGSLASWLSYVAPGSPGSQTT